MDSPNVPGSESGMSYEERAKRNRELMPGTAAMVDHFRAVFGPGVRLLWAVENGIEVGKRGDPGVPVSPPPYDPDAKNKKG